MTSYETPQTLPKQSTPYEIPQTANNKQLIPTVKLMKKQNPPLLILNN